MKEPGLDDRHRDKDGEIQQKRSDTLNKNLSRPIILTECYAWHNEGKDRKGWRS
jgi:hypothetical protein